MATRKPKPLPIALGVVLAVVLGQALLVPLFAAPSARLAPRHLPVVVAGPAPAADALAARLNAAVPDGFAVSRTDDEAAADRALRERRAYAAFIVGGSGVALHVASAAGPAVASQLSQSAAQLSAGAQVPVIDVVPGPGGDPHGTGFAAGFLPLLLTSAVAGLLLAQLVASRTGRVLGVLGFGVLGGLVGALVVRDWLGVVGGHYLPVAAAIGLLGLAASAAVAGLGSLLGRAGVTLGLLVTFLAGNALSGVASAPQLLPEPWGAIGQSLPAGAGGTLLRSVSGFAGHGAAGPVWVLGGWAAAGLLLIALAGPGRPGYFDPGRDRGPDSDCGSA